MADGIRALERELRAADADSVATRLREIPGIGLLTATALVGTVGHIHGFRRARQFATIAVANKLGRIVWAVWARDVEFSPRPALPEAA